MSDQTWKDRSYALEEERDRLLEALQEIEEHCTFERKLNRGLLVRIARDARFSPDAYRTASNPDGEA